MSENELLYYYMRAKDFVLKAGYQEEIDWQEQVTFDKMSDDDFLGNYVWVVISSGMKNQVARIIEKRAWETAPSFSGVGHPGKRKAIAKMFKEFPKHVEALKACKTDIEKVEYLGSLSWIGPITKWHLAKNLGLQVAKPDRHLVRIADSFNYNDVQEFCADIARASGDKLAVVDLIIWRYANLTGTRELQKEQQMLFKQNQSN